MDTEFFNFNAELPTQENEHPFLENYCNENKKENVFFVTNDHEVLQKNIDTKCLLENGQIYEKGSPTKDIKSVIIHDDFIARNLIKAGLDNTTLVLFDVDITLVYAEDIIAANDFCFPIYMDHYAKSTSSLADARALAIAAHSLAYSVANFKLVSEEFKHIFPLLDKFGADYMALTARDKGMSAATIRQLDNVGIDMSGDHPENKMFDLKSRPNAYFERNIIFCDNGHKGKCLTETLDKTKSALPTKIIFIDDKEKNLHQVRETSEEIGVPYLGIRYNMLDKWVKAQTRAKCIEHLENALHRFKINEEIANGA
jgi:hypothetical protein